MFSYIWLNILVGVVCGAVVGIISVPLSKKLALARIDDPAQISFLYKKPSYILFVVIGIIVCSGFVFCADSYELMIRNVILALPLICIACVDALIKKIPNSLLIFILAVQLVYLIYTAVTQKDSVVFLTALVGMFFGFLVCTIPGLLKIPIGAGDVKFSAVIGFFTSMMGYMQSMIIMGVLMLGYYIVLKIRKKGDIKSQVAFGPFLAVGTAVTMCFPLLSTMFSSDFFG